MLLKQWANEKKKMIHFYEKTKKNKTVLGQNSKEPSYQQKHQLMMIVMKKLLI